MKIKFLWSVLLLVASIIHLEAKDMFFRDASQLIPAYGTVHFDSQSIQEGNIVLSECGQYLIVEREGNYKITGRVGLNYCERRVGNLFLSKIDAIIVEDLFKPIVVKSGQLIFKKFKINKLFLTRGSYVIKNNFDAAFTAGSILITGYEVGNAFEITFEKLPHRG